MKKIILLFITIFTLVSCNNAENKEVTEESTTDKVKVTTSIIPLASITNYIGGDKVEAQSLVPAGVSPHAFDLTATQMVDLEKSDLIVYLGLEHVDGFLDKAVENKDNVVFVKTGIDLLESDSDSHDHEDEHVEHSEEELDHEDEHGHDDEHEDAEDHGDEHDESHEEDSDEHDTHSVDPHIWTSSENAYIIAKTILDQLVSISPENKEYFEGNLESFKAELDLTKKEFIEAKLEKTENKFIVFHDAYNYLLVDLDIDSHNKHIFRSNVLTDPNSSELKEIIDEIKEEGIKIAFREPQLNGDSLEHLSSDYGIQISTLDPLGTDQTSTGYITNYKNNLESLLKIYE